MKYAEVWLVNFDPQVGQEVRKKRPAVVVTNNVMGKLKLKVVVPVTDPSAKKQLWHVPLIPSRSNGLSKECVADCFQIKSISEERFISRLGELNENEISEIQISLMAVLNLL